MKDLLLSGKSVAQYFSRYKEILSLNVDNKFRSFF